MSTLDTPDTLDTLDTPDRWDTLDTLELARFDRECQGPWEAEYSYGDEADLHRHYDDCTKNPGHKNFIPVDKFSIDDLPERYRDNDMVDYNKAVSDLTVRVTVKYVSERRPETVGVSEKPYPGYRYKGQQRTTVGTGCVNRVSIINDEMSEKCMCFDCLESSTPRTKFARIEIKTAGHVVFDVTEAKYTTCHLFFDREGTPEKSEGVVALTGMSLWEMDIGSDMCVMHHYTHDLQLAQKLQKRCTERGYLKHDIRTKLPKTSFLKYSQPSLDKQPLLFIVSHPHGCSKQISIGRCTCSQQHPINRHSVIYTTATCPGSSGAFVCLPQKSSILGTWQFGSVYPTHVGMFDRQVGMNFSCIYTEARVVRDRLDLQQQDAGLWEEKLACGEEEDLHIHFDTCRKNPDHQKFFPVNKFSMDNLPPFYRNDQLMRMIQCVSDLTVRVSVKHVSEGRPETVPGTDNPYPWHSYRGSNQLRVGSGCVTKVECFINDACECEECHSSDTPKIGYSHIYVKTTAHHIYDELEGKHTTCHLFYDSGETPDACKGVVTLRNMCPMNTDNDSCDLVYKSHDLDLAGKLQDVIINLKDVNFLFSSLFCNEMDGTQNGASNETQAPRLDIVVSHPHGCAKHISIGYYGSHGNTDTENNQCLYNSITCPGSSGAPVIMLGREWLYPYIE